MDISFCMNLHNCINPANSVIVSFGQPTAEEEENPYQLLKVFVLFQIVEDFLNILCWITLLQTKLCESHIHWSAWAAPGSSVDNNYYAMSLHSLPEDSVVNVLKYPRMLTTNTVLHFKFLGDLKFWKVKTEIHCIWYHIFLKEVQWMYEWEGYIPV